MPKTHRPYAPEFRQQIIELARAGRTPKELSHEFGVSATSVTNWLAQATVDAGKPLPSNKDALTSAEREELSRLRRENRQLKTERDILAKATAWFANKSDPTSTPSSNS